MDEKMTQEERENAFTDIGNNLNEESFGLLYFVMTGDGIVTNVHGTYCMNDLKVIKKIVKKLIKATREEDIEDLIDEAIHNFVSRSNN